MSSSKPKRGFWVAIDGPAGSGKTSVGRRLAAALGFRFISTGAMYRAVAWGLRRGLPLEAMEIELRDGRVLFNGEDITEELYTEEIDQLTSEIARDPAVRQFLIKKQRALAQGQDVVMEGRDIGTVVLPDADVKLFLKASPAERARRRATERGSTPEEMLQEIAERDARDQGFGRLVPAPDAIVIDTENLSLEEVVARALAAVCAVREGKDAEAKAEDEGEDQGMAS